MITLNTIHFADVIGSFVNRIKADIITDRGNLYFHIIELRTTPSLLEHLSLSHIGKIIEEKNIEGYFIEIFIAFSIWAEYDFGLKMDS